jgi:predicted RNA binding protein YcfA (HicA-like mRNA interferase family)
METKIEPRTGNPSANYDFEANRVPYRIQGSAASKAFVRLSAVERGAIVAHFNNNPPMKNKGVECIPLGNRVARVTYEINTTRSGSQAGIIRGVEFASAQEVVATKPQSIKEGVSPRIVESLVEILEAASSARIDCTSLGKLFMRLAESLGLPVSYRGSHMTIHSLRGGVITLAIHSGKDISAKEVQDDIRRLLEACLEETEPVSERDFPPRPIPPLTLFQEPTPDRVRADSRVQVFTPQLTLCDPNTPRIDLIGEHSIGEHRVAFRGNNFFGAVAFFVGESEEDVRLATGASKDISGLECNGRRIYPIVVAQRYRRPVIIVGHEGVILSAQGPRQIDPSFTRWYDTGGMAYPIDPADIVNRFGNAGIVVYCRPIGTKTQQKIAPNGWIVEALELIPALSQSPVPRIPGYDRAFLSGLANQNPLFMVLLLEIGTHLRVNGIGSKFRKSFLTKLLLRSDLDLAKAIRVIIVTTKIRCEKGFMDMGSFEDFFLNDLRPCLESDEMCAELKLAALPLLKKCGEQFRELASLRPTKAMRVTAESFALSAFLQHKKISRHIIDPFFSKIVYEERSMPQGWVREINFKRLNDKIMWIASLSGDRHASEIAKLNPDDFVSFCSSNDPSLPPIPASEFWETTALSLAKCKHFQTPWGTLREHRIPGDGNCLFAAIGHCMGIDQETVRRDVYGFAEAIVRTYGIYGNAQPDDDALTVSYISRIIQISAFAEILINDPEVIRAARDIVEQTDEDARQEAINSFGGGDQKFIDAINHFVGGRGTTRQNVCRLAAAIVRVYGHGNDQPVNDYLDIPGIAQIVNNPGIVTAARNAMEQTNEDAIAHNRWGEFEAIARIAAILYGRRIFAIPPNPAGQALNCDFVRGYGTRGEGIDMGPTVLQLNGEDIVLEDRTADVGQGGHFDVLELVVPNSPEVVFQDLFPAVPEIVPQGTTMVPVATMADIFSEVQFKFHKVENNNNRLFNAIALLCEAVVNQNDVRRKLRDQKSMWNEKLPLDKQYEAVVDFAQRVAKMYGGVYVLAVKCSGDSADDGDIASHPVDLKSLQYFPTDGPLVLASRRLTDIQAILPAMVVTKKDVVVLCFRPNLQEPAKSRVDVFQIFPREPRPMLK